MLGPHGATLEAVTFAPEGIIVGLRRRRAKHPNHVRAIDFAFDETSDYRRLKVLNILDEFTREALAMDVDRSITAEP